MPRPPGQKRGRILDAALRAFCERGYAASTLTLIGRYAGVAPGTIYLYFEHKQALLNELFRYWKRQLIAATVDDHTSQNDPRLFFESFWMRVLRFGREHPRAYVFVVLNEHAEYLDDESRQLDQDFFGAMEGFLARHGREGLMQDGHPVVASALVRGTIDKLVGEALEGRIELSDEVIREAAGRCWRALLGRP